MKNLDYLHINFNSNFIKNEGLDEMGRAFKELKQLKHLEFRFYKNNITE